MPPLQAHDRDAGAGGVTLPLRRSARQAADHHAAAQTQQQHSAKHASVRAALVQRAQQADDMQTVIERTELDAAAQTRAPSAVSSVATFQPLHQSDEEHYSATVADAPPSAASPELAVAIASPLSPVAVTSGVPAAPSVPAAPAPLSLGNFLARLIPKRVLGITYLALSAVIFSVMALFVSILSTRLPSFEIVWARCFLQFACGWSSCRFYGINFLGPPEKRKWLLVRGGMGFAAFSCYYFAMSVLTLSDSTTIFFTAPLYTGLLGWIFLGERVSRVDLGLTLASVVGVVMVVRPEAIFGSSGESSTGGGVGDHASTVDPSSSASSSAHTAGIIAAIAGSLISAFVYIAIRKVGPGVNPLVLVCYMGLVGNFLAPLGATIQHFTWPSASSWGLLLLVGIFSFVGQIFFNAGVQMEKAGPASMIRNLDVAFSFMWQMVAQGIAPSGWSVGGAIVISASVICMGVRKWRADEQAERKKALEAAVPAAGKLIGEGGAVAAGVDDDPQAALARTLARERAESAHSGFDAITDDDMPMTRVMRSQSLELESSDVGLQQPDSDVPPEQQV